MRDGDRNEVGIQADEKVFCFIPPDDRSISSTDTQISRKQQPQH